MNTNKRKPIFLVEFILPAVSTLNKTDPTIKSINYDYLFRRSNTKFDENSLTKDIISLLEKVSNEEQSFKLQLIISYFRKQRIIW